MHPCMYTADVAVSSIHQYNATVLIYLNFNPLVATLKPQSNGPSSSSRMRVLNHNWSATKQRPHPQSVAEISHHSVLSGDRIRQCETSSGSRHKDTDQCL